MKGDGDMEVCFFWKGSAYATTYCQRQKEFGILRGASADATSQSHQHLGLAVV